MTETATVPDLVKWTDSPLTEKVAWAMGVEAADKEAEANGGRVDRKARTGDWWFWLGQRGCPDGPLFPGSMALSQDFQHGWQAQRAELLAEYVGKMLSDAMHHFCFEGQKADSIFEQFTERLNLDEWFAGASD